MLRKLVKLPGNKLWTPSKRFGSSKHIRQSFINYFKDRHNHAFVKSSPVLSLRDRSVPFVNAGMNQFKGVFLGTVVPPSPRVVNSQKCIRVGGKHNDLDVVGTDGYHHTFFEMLGNWSFGDYYKEEACQMAWKLICEELHIDPKRLRVTYFQGENNLGLAADLETKEIWTNLGVSIDNIWPCGAADNFWEMGATGPCGPCTEIHYVNDDGTLTELWNIVFIQYNRESDGSVSSLPRQHVDTGMGLERMARVLQGRPSNYHTDLFAPIIRAIHELSNGRPEFAGRYGEDAAIDVAYRRLADHARMVAVCLADCTVPAANLNLKQIMRRAFKISSEVFDCGPGSLEHLYDAVAESLGDAYPELLAKQKDAKLIIHQEESSYRRFQEQLRKDWKGLLNVYPEIEQLGEVELQWFALGYKYLKEKMSNSRNNTIPGELIFRLYDTYGFTEELIQQIAAVNKYNLDKDSFKTHLLEYKSRHKAVINDQADKKGLLFDDAIKQLNDKGIVKTNDQHKYDFKVDKNTFEPLRTKLQAILDSKGNLLYELSSPKVGDVYYVVTEGTNMFCEEGGQASDTGAMLVRDRLRFEVEDVFKLRDLVFHKGTFLLEDGALHTVLEGCDVTININGDRRLEIMKHHTATHLLYAAIRLMLPNSVLYQSGCKVSDSGLVLSLTVYGEKIAHDLLYGQNISHDTVYGSQRLVQKAISAKCPVKSRIISSFQLSREPDVTTVPGEVYPDAGLRLVEIRSDELMSKELCYGTHVPSTSHIEDFYITLVKSLRTQTPSVYAIAGKSAIKARKLFDRAEVLYSMKASMDKEGLMREVTDLRQELTNLCGTSGTPVADYAKSLRTMGNLVKEIKVERRNKAEV